MNQAYISFIANGLSKGHWLYIEEAAVYIINFIPSFANPNSINPYKRWAYRINLSVEYIKPFICTRYI
jgi:hypothetical protein